MSTNSAILLSHVWKAIGNKDILNGINYSFQTSAITAVLGRIGSGKTSLGEFIVTGLALNSTPLILMGAIPAAVLAILTELLERMMIKKHLRQSF